MICVTFCLVIQWERTDKPVEAGEMSGKTEVHKKVKHVLEWTGIIMRVN
jgi:hypothetical protein